MSSGSFEFKVTGGLFIAGALLFWLGWILLPHRIGTFFDPGDFAAVHQRLYLWIWMYRFHLFGFVLSAMALVSLAAAASPGPARVLLWPGAAAGSAGLFVGAVAAAFYYHFGAWGAVDMAGQNPEAIRSMVDSLRVPTEYVTCLVRFGRVFLGLGLVAVGLGLLKSGLLPASLGISSAVIGTAAMAAIMGFPDRPELHQPVFHLEAAWLLAAGAVLVRRGPAAAKAVGRAAGGGLRDVPSDDASDEASGGASDRPSDTRPDRADLFF